MISAHRDDHDTPVATLTLPALSTLWFRHQVDPHLPTPSQY